MVKIKKKAYVAKEHQEQEIVSIMHKTSALLSEYKKQLLFAVSALVCIAVIAGGVSLIRSQQEQKASPLFDKAYAYYSPTTGLAADFPKALGLFRDIQMKYPNTKNGAVAQYYIGNCLVNLRQYDEALREYQAFLKKYSREKWLTGLVYQRMGYLYQAVGKQEEAIKAFEQAESAAGAGLATIELARLYEGSGNNVESQKKYKLALDKLSGTTLGMEAMGKVQKIEPVPQPPEKKEVK